MRLFSLRREGGLHGTVFNHRQQCNNNNQQRADKFVRTPALEYPCDNTAELRGRVDDDDDDAVLV